MYFGMRVDSKVSVEDPVLVAHAGAFMNKFGEAVESLNDTERLAEIVTSLGASHVDRDIDIKDLCVSANCYHPIRICILLPNFRW